MKSTHLIISGKVQGVWYRNFVKSNAESLDLSGWVCNTLDGKVEAVFQGELNAIRKMIKLCHQGPESSQVKDVKVKWEDNSVIYNDFLIK